MNSYSADRRDNGHPTARALVLSGGGPLGIGWEAGLVTGFAESGVDFANADLIVGTSAGSVVGAHVALGLELSDTLNTVAAFGALLDAGGMEFQFQALLDAMAKAAESESPEQGRRMVGRLAVEATTVAEEQFVGIAPQLDGRSWPNRYACTAVDVETGALQVWDAETDAPLARAVASSCAAPLTLPPVTINGRRYMDGGLRTNLNADLAAGHDRVVAVSCLPLSLPDGLGDPTFSAWAAAQEAELDTVREGGGAVEVIEPGEEFLTLSGGGANLSEVGRAGEAYEAGVRQARLELDRIHAVWNG